MSIVDLEVSRLPGLGWILERPWLWRGVVRSRRRVDIRDLSAHLRRDIGLLD